MLHLIVESQVTSDHDRTPMRSLVELPLSTPVWTAVLKKNGNDFTRKDSADEVAPV